MRYVIAVKSPVYGYQGAYLAYQLAQALIVKQHQISQIFFFQDGVSNGNACVNPNNDEFNLPQAWQQLAIENNIALCLCVSASQRRGVVDNLTAKNEITNLAKGFQITGLGEFMVALLQSDRVITL